MRSPVIRRSALLLSLLFVGATSLSLAESGPVRADDDPLKALLDKNSCEYWKEISQLGRDRLQSRNTVQDKGRDPRLIAMSFALLDHCARDIESQLIMISQQHIGGAGVAGNGSDSQQRARVDAALVAFHAEAYPSQLAATRLKTWPSLASAAGQSRTELQGLVDRQFGEGSFAGYIAAKSKAESARTQSDRQLLNSLQPWMDPL